MLLGVGLTFETYLTTALSAKPSLVPALIRPPVGPWVNLPFIVFNTLLEWLLLPVCLLVNWDTPKRRRLVIAAAIAFYAMRIWSYVYFIPAILAWSSVLPERAPPEIRIQIGQWASLSWVRLAIDGLVNVLFLLAAFVPPSSDARTSGLA
jgi:hypothetical protein